MPLILKMAGFYIAINAAIMLVLGANVIRMRGRTRTMLGDGESSALLQAIRAHGNNTEYTPIALILLIAVILLGGHIILVHVIGIALTAGRLIHAYAILSPAFWSRRGPGGARIVGMALTQLAVAVGIVAVLWLVLAATA